MGSSNKTECDKRRFPGIHRRRHYNHRYEKGRIVIDSTNRKLIAQRVRLLPQFHFQVQIDSTYVLHRLDNAGDVLESYEISRGEMGSFMTDYSFIGKIKGPGNNAVLLITSGDEVGLAQAIKMLTTPGFQDDLEN